MLVCRSGQRASQAEETLRGAGLVNVHILEGGITAWEGKGYPSIAAPNAGIWNAKSALLPARPCSLSILGSIAAPKLKWLAAGMGGGLAVAALTNTCAMGMLLSRLPYNRGTGM